MADVEITHEEVRGIDINQVASMQLKDGTVVVVNPEATAEGGDYQDEGGFAQEELAQDEYDQAGEENVDEANELRARPMVGMPYGVRPGVPVRPAVVPVRPGVVPVRPAVVPGRPVVVPKPVPRGPVVRPGMPMGGQVFRARPIVGPRAPVRPAVVPVRPGVVPVRPGVVPVRPAVVPVRPAVLPKPVPRGPVVRPGMPMGGQVFRARPGMPVHMPPPKMVVAPKPYAPARPGVPTMRPVVPGPMMPKPVPVRPAVMPTRPLVPGQRPLVFRARPNYNEEEEDFQEEYAGEEDYYECDEYEGVEEENQLRARPLVVPAPMTYAPGVVRPPVHHPPHRPHVVAPGHVAPIPVKRGPAVVRPGYNTFQPGVFRARPRMVAARPAVRPMMAPLAPGYGVGRVVRPMPPPPRPYGFGMGQVFRSRPATTEQDYTEEYAEEYDTEGCDYNQSCVCTKCGKEF